MSELPLFAAAPYQASSEASKKAAEGLSDKKRKTQAVRVLEHIRQYVTGATCSEICAATGIPVQSTTARLNDLTLAGAIVKADYTRTNMRGNEETVWMFSGVEPTSKAKLITKYSAGGRDALLALKEWIIQRNTLKGGWWLRDDGKDIIARIEQTIKGEDPNVTITHTDKPERAAA